MDSTLKCWVAIIDAVSCQDEDTLVVFQLSEKDADQRIAVDVSLISYSQEDVRFVEQ